MSGDELEINDRYLQIVGGGSALMHMVVFTVLGELVLENIVYGAIVGLFAGIGAFLFLPWFLRLSAIQDHEDDEIPFSDVIEKAGGNPQMAVYGLGLELGGIAMFAMFAIGLGFGDGDPIIGLGVAIAVTIAVSLVATALLRR